MLESIGVAAEIINYDYQEIKNLLTEVLLKKLSIKDPNVRVPLFRAAWSIVDRVDLIRLILYNQRNHIVLQNNSAREAVFQTCKAMRNEMDHLGSNARKHAKTRVAFPVFGMLTFNWNREEDFKIHEGENHILRQNVTVITASSFQNKFEQNADLLFDDQFYLNQVGNINLFAFDQQLALASAVSLVAEITTFLEDGLSEAAVQRSEKPLEGPIEVILTKTFDSLVPVA